MKTESCTTSRLDELFSPERLSQNWPMKTTPLLEPMQVSSNLDIHVNYQKLQCLIAKKFPDVSRLSGRFDELTEEINQIFPLDFGADPVDVESKQAIVIMLEKLEELLWALDLSKRGQG